MDASDISNFELNDDKRHVTQILWGTSCRVGCDYIQFTDDSASINPQKVCLVKYVKEIYFNCYTIPK